MKYKEIADFIKEGVSKGKIRPGSKIPSIRELCRQFKCTKSTVLRAYSELREEGIVYAVSGSGYFLIDSPEDVVHSNTVIDFSGTSLDVKSLPYTEFQPCISQAIIKYKEELFSYTDPQGLPALIDAVRRHLQDHQVFADNDEIFITTGSQQALSILSRLPFPNGKENVVVEQPTYQGILQCLKQNNITAIGVPRDFKGLDSDALERSFRNDNVRFFYTIPRFNNPLGLSYSQEEKKRICYLAEKYNIYIVEDDYLGDLESNPKCVPAYAIDMSDRVIYVKTFSKVLLPGLRVAAVVLPKLLRNTFKEYKYWSDLNTPLLSQGALEIFLNSGMFNMHINKTKEMYSKRMTFLRELASKYSSQALRWHIPSKAGFYAGIEIMNGSSKFIIESLRKKDIMLSNLENHYLKEFYNEKCLRLSIANTDLDKMEAGIREIKSVTEKNKSEYDNIFKSNL